MMKRLLLGFAFGGAAALLVVPCFPAFAGEQAIKSAVPIMPVSKVKRGMKATGRTVYEGDEIETFQGEILGVMPGGWGPDSDIILMRLTGAKADRYGIAAGMSGSPVYIDGKLIGALSLAYGGFQREPIAGITPIESMLKVPAGLRAEAPVKMARGEESATDLKPILTPVVLSGFDPKAVPYVQKMFREFGLPMVSGHGGGKSKPMSKKKLEPGAAVAGVLVQGDVNIQGVGTLTYADDEIALAFGHSFLLYGDIEMPMASAHVVTTVPSDNLSFKVAYPEEVIGSIVRDNRTAIAGRLGRKADMIPVKLHVKRNGGTKTYNFEVFRNKALTALMLNVAVMNAMVGTPGYNAEGTVRVEGRIRFDGYEDVSLERLFFDLGPSGSLIPVALSDLNAILGTVLNNPLAPARVEDVELHIAASPATQLTRIEAAWLDRNAARAGEKLTVHVRIRPFHGPALIRDVEIQVPESTPAGALTISVAGGDKLDSDRPIRATGPTDLAHLIRVLNERRADDAMYVRITRDAPGVVIRGVEMDALPPTVLSVVQENTRDEDAMSKSNLAEVKVPLDARVVGDVTLQLTVK